MTRAEPSAKVTGANADAYGHKAQLCTYAYHNKKLLVSCYRAVVFCRQRAFFYVWISCNLVRQIFNVICFCGLNSVRFSESKEHWFALPFYSIPSEPLRQSGAFA